MNFSFLKIFCVVVASVVDCFVELHAVKVRIIANVNTNKNNFFIIVLLSMTSYDGILLDIMLP